MRLERVPAATLTEAVCGELPEPDAVIVAVLSKNGSLVAVPVKL
jgi:hypothetical protein